MINHKIYCWRKIHWWLRRTFGTLIIRMCRALVIHWEIFRTNFNLGLHQVTEKIKTTTIYTHFYINWKIKLMINWIFWILRKQPYLVKMTLKIKMACIPMKPHSRIQLSIVMIELQPRCNFQRKPILKKEKDLSQQMYIRPHKIPHLQKVIFL